VATTTEREREHWDGPTRKSEEGGSCGETREGSGQAVAFGSATGNRRRRMDATKPFTIPKRRVMEAFKAVKANAGGAFVDQQSIEDFEKDLKDNSRISAGTGWRREATCRRRSRR
jgi:hypothetical protein